MKTSENEQRKSQLHILSSATKIFIEGIFLIIIVVLPRFTSIQIKDHLQVTVCILLAFFSSLIFEIIIYIRQKRNQSFDTVLNIQLVSSVLLLIYFLHHIDRINGPFFLLFGLTLMESSLNLNLKVALLVVTMMITSTVSEWIWMVTRGEITPNFINAILLLVRILFLIFITSYSRALTKTIIAERESRKQIEDLNNQLQKANLHLKELDHLKDDFISVTSHELRTPLTAIRSYLWLALGGKGGPLTEKMKYYLDRSYNSTVRLIKLVNDILNISRIESGRMNFVIEKIDMVKLVEEVIDEVRPRAEELKIKLVVNSQQLAVGSRQSVGDGFPAPENRKEKIENRYVGTLRAMSVQLFVIGDGDKIKEVLINLIGNALKFTKENGLIQIGFEEKDNEVIIGVKDNGEGIEKEDIPKLFQKFGMIQNSYITNQKAAQGTGLGLFICKSIIEKLGGQIWVSSLGKDQGSTFSFSLKK